MEVNLITSEKEKPLLLRWRCTRKGCSAKMYSSKKSLCEIVESNLVQNYEKDAAIARQIVSNSLKGKSKDNLEEKPSKLVRKELKDNSAAGCDLTAEDMASITKNL